jgi:hypothetical protein
MLSSCLVVSVRLCSFRLRAGSAGSGHGIEGAPPLPDWRFGFCAFVVGLPLSSISGWIGSGGDLSRTSLGVMS